MRYGQKPNPNVQEYGCEVVEERPPSRSKEHRLTSWLLEAAGLLGSMACITAIFILLRTYDDQPVPEWNWITLNGIISVLSDLAHACLMYPVSEAIGQLKWVWLWKAERPRRIADFETYNCASRGPWGGLAMLLKPRLWHLSSLGALLTILALAMQTFLQLMPIYVPKPVVLTSNATITRSTSYTEYDLDSFNIPTSTSGMSATINIGLFAASSDQTPLRTDCATGNCTWPEHESLGVCSACQDVSDYLNGSSYKDFGLRYYITTRKYQFSIARTNPSIMYSRLANVSIGTFVLSYFDFDDKNNTDQPHHLDECALYYCVRTYDTSTVNARLVENVTETFPNLTSTSEEINAKVTNVTLMPAGYNNTQNYTNIEGAGGGHFLVNTWSTFALHALISNSIALSMANVEWGVPGYDSVGKRIYVMAHQNNGTAILWETLASGLTTYMRNSGNETIAGDAYITRTFVEVRWEWISLPLGVLALAMVFMIATVVLSNVRGVPTWKNSVIPSLVYQLDTDTATNIAREGPDLRGLEKQAKEYSMSVAVRDGRLGLVGSRDARRDMRSGSESNLLQERP